VVGLASFGIDIGSLKIFHGVLHFGLALSTVIAFALAFFVNFTASRQWVFTVTAHDNHARRQVIRYLALVAINLILTLLIVVGLSALGIPYLLAKVVAASINAVGNFFAYRHWVFASPRVPQDSKRISNEID
jgi:putative flippase GtrA